MIYDGIRYEDLFGRILLPGVGTVFDGHRTAAWRCILQVNEMVQGPFWFFAKVFIFPVRVHLDARNASTLPV